MAPTSSRFFIPRIIILTRLDIITLGYTTKFPVWRFVNTRPSPNQLTASTIPVTKVITNKMFGIKRVFLRGRRRYRGHFRYYRFLRSHTEIPSRVSNHLFRVHDSIKFLRVHVSQSQGSLLEAEIVVQCIVSCIIQFEGFYRIPV
jgi:hypothetical protein